MKKLLLIVSFLGFAIGNAQESSPATASFSEGFDGATIPAGWTTQNLSAPIGSNVNCWNSFGATPWTPQAGAGHVGANFNCTSGAGTISGWLFSPVIMFQNGDQLKFWTRVSTGGGAFPDRLELRISTNNTSVDAGTTATSVGDFTTLLLSVNPTLSATGYPETFTEYTATISGLAAAVNGRAAFRYFVTDGGPSGTNSNILSIDTFSYVNSSLAVDNATNKKMAFYPNPTTDFLNFNTKVSAVQIFDASGRNVTSTQLSKSQIDVRNLAKGVYIVKFETEKGSQTEKFIKQ